MLTEATVRCNVTEEHRSAGVWISMIERCLGHGHQESLNVGLWRDSRCVRRSAKWLLDGKEYHLLESLSQHVSQMEDIMLCSVTHTLVFAGVLTRMELRNRVLEPVACQAVE